MPRPKQNQSSPKPLSPGQAAYVLDQLIKERRISQGEINRYVGDMGREISDLESRLQRLREAHGAGSSSSSSSSAAAPAPARRGPGRPPGSANKKPGRPAGTTGRPGRPPGRPPASAAASTAAAPAAPAKGGAAAAKKGGAKSKAAITAEQLASRQLQGRYLALVRQFPEKKRADYAKIAKEKGREAAIKEMQDARK
ncbi:MAG TPA: hypothetical protein VF608_04540 [Thermoanaerobaculia bacterium]